jgi:hypothetical protein
MPSITSPSAYSPFPVLKKPWRKRALAGSAIERSSRKINSTFINAGGKLNLIEHKGKIKFVVTNIYSNNF